MKITDRIKKFMNRNNPELIAGKTKLDKKINEKANEIEKLYVTRKENGEEYLIVCFERPTENGFDTIIFELPSYNIVKKDGNYKAGYNVG